MKKKTPWRPIKSCRIADGVEVDIWMKVYASPMSFGMGDSFRVVDAYRKDGKWFHRHEFQEKELRSDLITHWMPIPKDPNP